MVRSSLRLLAISVLVPASGLLPATSDAQVARRSASDATADYPRRPVRMVVPFAPGGGTDIIARVLAAKVGSTWGQPVVVDNRSGGGGSIGTNTVAKAPHDGYTLLLSSVSIAYLPALYTKLPFDTNKELAPVALLVTQPSILVVHPSIPAKSVAEFITLANAKPGELRYSSGGSGSASHLAVELLRSTAKVSLVHVPYKGGGPAMQDVISGHVKIMFSSLIQTTPFIQSGQLKALGTGGAKRSPVLPDVPTIAEAGVPGYLADNWWGLAAPAGTPAPIVEKLYQATQAALKAPELQAQFAREGAVTIEMSSAAFADYIKVEIAKWGRVIKEGNIKAQ